MACPPVTFATVVEEEFKHIGLGVSYQQVPEQDLARAPKALCLSGGGIRSATFALGVLQALAKRKLLSEFHYLSTVSGGGYIGAWLSAWLQRTSVDTVLEGLQKPDAEPVRHLRQYSNYLSPRLGLLSADTWTLAAIFIRNLLLNWVILLPTLTAAILVPYVCVAFLQGRTPGFGKPLEAWAGLAIGFLLGVYAIALIPRWLPCLAGKTSLTSESEFVLRHVASLVLACVALTTAWFYLRRAGWPGACSGSPASGRSCTRRGG